MKFSLEDIKRSLRLGEDSVWEFKEIVFANNTIKSNRDSLADEIAAFANTTGGALLCSVTNKGKVQDLTREQMYRLEQMFVGISSESIKPPVYIKTFRHEIDKKPLLLVEVPEGTSQYDSPGGSFHRVGSSKKSLNSDERLRLAQQRGQVRFIWFDKQPVPETGFQTLKESLWKPLLSEESLRIDTQVALEKMGLLVIDENGIKRATVAGVLLCSEHPEKLLSNACITATCYRGKDRASDQIDAKTIGGPLDQQIAQAINFAIINMHIAAHKTPAREEIPQYSKEALFEAIVNAVIHRDYSIRSIKIRLSLFTDRIEIQSPGALPNSLTVEQMAYRQSTRNELLVSILKRRPAGEIHGTGGRTFIMEERGDGISIIRRKTKELTGKEPKFQLIGESELCVTLPAAVTLPTDPFHSMSTTIKVCCDSKDQPVSGADVLVLFSNNTWKRATTDNKGNASFKLSYPMMYQIPISIFVAGVGLEAVYISDWLPKEHKTVTKKKLQDGGSVIFPDGTGQIPDISGRLNPIRDTLDRTYLYASNIAINQGQQQPVHFMLKEELRLTDSNGKEMFIRIIQIKGTSSLVEFHPVNKLRYTP